MINPPDFMIFGTPRSGTTLVQRLACELPGVRVPPETHFLALFALDLVRSVRFPLVGSQLREQLVAYSSIRVTAGLDLDIDRTMSLLQGRCAGVGEMFSAVVRSLVGDGFSRCGEKTPDHLLWWRPLHKWFPDVSFVGVVRDPRAVVASNLEVPFGMDHPSLLAERWVRDQRQLRLAMHRLGPQRLLVLRYEDVVADPDRARRRMAAHLGLEPRTTAGEGVPLHTPLFLEGEIWKTNAAGPVTTARVEAWRDALSPSATRQVTRICGREMQRWAYPSNSQPGSAALAEPRSCRPLMDLKRAYFLLHRLQQQRRINQVAA